MSQERIEDSIDTPWWGEHDQRYVEALKHIDKNFTILDIACGNGFGTYKLYEQTQNVVIGGDVSDEALIYCKKKYQKHLKKDTFDFRKLDATALDFKDNTFNAVVSFETIEHIADYNKVIAEFKRVLKPGGILLLSTPNIVVSSPDGIVVNPYHVKEFTYDELSSLLSPFQTCSIGGQQYVRYKNKNSRLAFLTERFLYMRGIRRLSTGLKNGIMKILGVSNFYPTSDDYEIVWPHDQVVKCLTFFAICRK
jgi:ubiquinone/menaquinone biosynthesis C-methylase UbiE